MKKKQKGFASIIFIGIFLILIAVGYFAWSKNSDKVAQTKDSITMFPEKNNTELKTSIPTQKNQTSDWKTYKNDKYGFEFKYPVDWQTSENADNITIVPNISQTSIQVFLSNSAIATIECPFSIHEIECKVMKNDYENSYVRSINTGQLSLYKVQQLNAFFVNSNVSVQFIATLTDEKGNPDPDSTSIVRVFDQISSTFKFTK